VFFESPPLLPLTLLISLSFQHAANFQLEIAVHSMRPPDLPLVCRSRRPSGYWTQARQPNRNCVATIPLRMPNAMS